MSLGKKDLRPIPSHGTALAPPTEMPQIEEVPLARCRLDGEEAVPGATLRYVPMADLDLWRFLMEGRHGRRVSIEAVSVWVPERACWWGPEVVPEDLVPVLRLVFERPGPGGVRVPMERFFPAESAQKAVSALLSHFPGAEAPRQVDAIPGYFLGRGPLAGRALRPGPTVPRLSAP